MTKDDAAYDFLHDHLARYIASFNIRIEDAKRKAFQLRMAVVTFGALTTLLLGLKSSPLVDPKLAESMSALALIFSAATPVFAAYDAFYDHKWLWARYTTARNALYSISDDLEYYRTEGDLSKELLKKFYERMESVLQETDAAWAQHRERLEAPPSEPPNS